MRIFLSVLLAISLAGCTTQTPEVTEMPSSQIQQAPEAEEGSEIAETEVEAMPKESQETGPAERAESTEEAQTPSAKPSAKPTPSASETEAPEREESPEPTQTPTRSPEPTQTPTRSPEPTPTPTPTKTKSGYALADVAKNNSQASCWVAIEGMVYDLTNWIRLHPGGRAAILSLCGTDGTSSFRGAHGGQTRPTATLSGYLLGPLTN
jgi:outer membrane biosynthesis protein TonB